MKETERRPDVCCEEDRAKVATPPPAARGRLWLKIVPQLTAVVCAIWVSVHDIQSWGFGKTPVIYDDVSRRGVHMDALGVVRTPFTFSQSVTGVLVHAWLPDSTACASTNDSAGTPTLLELHLQSSGVSPSRPATEFEDHTVTALASGVVSTGLTWDADELARRHRAAVPADSTLTVTLRLRGVHGNSSCARELNATAGREAGLGVRIVVTRWGMAPVWGTAAALSHASALVTCAALLVFSAVWGYRTAATRWCGAPPVSHTEVVQGLQDTLTPATGIRDSAFWRLEAPLSGDRSLECGCDDGKSESDPPQRARAAGAAARASQAQTDGTTHGRGFPARKPARR